jgi:CRP-like cAMP-binding protein
MMGLANDIDRLVHVDVFRHLSREFLGVLALTAQTSMIRARQVVCHAGEPANGGYLIINGTLALQFVGVQSRDDIYLPSGSFFGEAALLTPIVWDVTLYAHTPVMLMHIPRKDFLRLIKSYPEAVPLIKKFFVEKLQNLIATCESIFPSDGA